MVTGASTADLAVILIDARKGVLTQTRRHSFLAHLIGIRHIVLAVNKMDLVDHDQARFEEIVADYSAFAHSIGITGFTAIPLSGLTGANILASSDAMPWYEGPALLPHLETVPIEADQATAAPFRLPVQWVNRPDLDFRGFAGTIAAGRIRAGDPVRIVPSGKTSKVARIVTYDGDRNAAGAGEAVTLVLADEVDCSRGDVIAAADAPPEAANQFEATVVWLADTALVPGRGYWLKLGTRTVGATVQPPAYVVDVNTQAHLSAKTLELNDIGVAEVFTDAPLVFQPMPTATSSAASS